MFGKEAVIVYSRRTPICRFNGHFKSTPAPELSAPLIKDACNLLDIAADSVDQVYLGQVLSAGVGQAPARQAAIKGGLDEQTPCCIINKVCGSGLQSIILAAQAIKAGDSNIVFAGGQENMSLAPYLLPKMRQGQKFGSSQVLDHIEHDGLLDHYNNLAMGSCGELCAREYGFSRQQQDEYALRSYQLAKTAQQKGLFAAEMLPIAIKYAKQVTTVSCDEEPFAANLERLSSLRPVFAKDGTITAGNASSLNDGAALTVVMSADEAKKRGLTVLATISAYDISATSPVWFTKAPVISIKNLLTKTRLTVSDIDLFEVNEAFSVVPLLTSKLLNIKIDKMNVRGGAVALGHPIGASGARIVATLISLMQDKSLKQGIASICIGGGEACSILLSKGK